jgi:hypothetical protein
MAWIGKACVGCDGRKGIKYADRKFCGRCTAKVRRTRGDATHDRTVSQRYGMQLGDYAKLYAVQGGVCALCLRATGRSRRLSVDHDHKTGEVRGLLCRTCNDLLGHARDEATFFHRAIAYLVTPPARVVLSASQGVVEPGGLL